MIYIFFVLILLCLNIFNKYKEQFVIQQNIPVGKPPMPELQNFYRLLLPHERYHKDVYPYVGFLKIPVKDYRYY